VACRVTDLSDHTLATLRLELEAQGFKPSHAGPMLRSHYRAGSGADANGRRLPEALSRRLSDQLERRSASTLSRQLAQDGTAKLLIRLGDGRTVESVLMPGYRPDRAAGCLSSQVGCAMGCDFCATTKTGFERNLSSGEIVEQFLALRQQACARGRRLSTVVFMGMGEPLLNLDPVCAAIERMAGNDMGGLGFRQVTVSTVGIVPGIDALAATGLNVHLAISLHAPDDETRTRLLPMGRRYGLGEILQAADRYQASSGRTVSVQYCLLGGVNDSKGHAEALAGLIGDRRMHVNLLRYNPTGISLRGEVYRPSTDEATEAFIGLLAARGVVAHIRRSRGPDIDAACGQLRHKSGTSGLFPRTTLQH